MRLPHRWRPLAVIGTFVALSTAATAAISSTPVLAPDENVAGVSQSTYTERWWQWAMRQPYDAKPYQDETGASCAVDQSGPVFFLAGTDGSGPFHRRCEVPAGKFLFMPVINNLSTNRPGYRSTCSELVTSSATNNNHLTQTDVHVDGAIVPNVGRYRQKTPACFDAFPGNPDARGHFPAASDGYWLMIPPLTPGTHTISVHAKYNNPDCRCAFHDMEQDFDYVITVRDPSPSKVAPPRPRPASATAVP